MSNLEWVGFLWESNVDKHRLGEAEEGHFGGPWVVDRGSDFGGSGSGGGMNVGG